MGNPSIAERIRNLRVGAGLTQEQAAEAWGVTSQTISRIENGDQPRALTLGRIARGAGVPLSDLLDGSPDGERVA